MIKSEIGKFWLLNEYIMCRVNLLLVEIAIFRVGDPELQVHGTGELKIPMFCTTKNIV